MNIVAHRGISLYKVPENLLLAIDLALKKGFQVETDLQITKDRKIVLYHDDFVPGPDDKDLNGGGFYLPSGKKPVVECMSDELLLKTQFDRAKHETILAKQAGEPVTLELNRETPKIATLDELLLLIKQYPQAKVFLEIKRLDDNLTYDDGMEEIVVNAVNERGLADNVIITSFNESVLKNTRKVDTQITVAADVYKGKAESTSEAKRMRDELGISFWEPPFKQITSDLISNIEALGLQIATWVWNENKIEELNEIRRLKALGLKTIMTNQSETVANLIK